MSLRPLYAQTGLRNALDALDDRTAGVVLQTDFSCALPPSSCTAKSSM
jgi:hypothetical protein